MGTISADTFRRIYLLYLLSRFQNGAYGLKRVHKVAYIPQRAPGAVRPFEFRRYLFGQHSETLDDIKDQLISMGYVLAVPLDTAMTTNMAGREYSSGGNRFFVRDATKANRYRQVLAALSPDIPRLIDRTVKEYGYLIEQDLVKACYHFPEFGATAPEQVIFEANIGERVVIDLPEDECADLELAFNPVFIETMVRLNEALETRPIEWEGVHAAEGLPPADA